MEYGTWIQQYNRLVSAYPIGNLTDEIGASWFKELAYVRDDVIIGAVSQMIEKVRVPSLQRLKECVRSVKKELGGDTSHIQQIQDYANSLSREIGIDAMLLINRKWGYTWLDLPQHMTQEVKDYLREVHETGTMYEILNPDLAEQYQRLEAGEELKMHPDAERFLRSYVNMDAPDPEPSLNEPRYPNDW